MTSKTSNSSPGENTQPTITSSDIAKEPAGRRLDSWVAEARGWSGSLERINTSTWKRPDGMYRFVPTYSTSISDAWELVEEVTKTGARFDLINCDCHKPAL